MLVISLIILSLYLISMMFKFFHQDEIHHLVAFISGLTALIVLFLLTPILVKCLLGILVLAFFEQITFIHKN